MEQSPLSTPCFLSHCQASRFSQEHGRSVEGDPVPSLEEADAAAMACAGDVVVWSCTPRLHPKPASPPGGAKHRGWCGTDGTLAASPLPRTA